MVLGLPASEWVILPLLGFLIGMYLYGALSKQPVFRTWLIGIVFFGARFLLESANEIGRPDRIFAVMALWTLTMAAVAVSREWMDRVHK